jgi:YD repeat-containing protein
MLCDIHSNGMLSALLPFLLALQSASGRAAASNADHQREPASAASLVPSPTLSDREKAGLRGPVEECTSESTRPEGPGSPSWRMVNTTKYDPDGKIYQTGYINNDGSKGTQSFTYTADGRLLRTVWDTNGKTSDTIYTYDSRDRVIAVTSDADWSTSFEYDENGRKTRILKSKLKASDNGSDRSHSGADIESENADLFVFPPAGGTVKTSYNEQDQAYESLVYGPIGELRTRLTRAYDAKGRVVESSLFIENFDSFMSPEERARLAAEPGALEKAQEEIAHFLGDQGLLTRSTYVYDDQGHIVEKHRRFASREEITRITYNDRGDEAEESETASDPSRPTEQSGARFSYEYDSVGNWIEKTVSSPSTANQSSKIWSVERRTLKYY